MKRSCPFDPPQRSHPQLQIVVPEQAQLKRKSEFEVPNAKRFCTHETLKRKNNFDEEVSKRVRTQEAESMQNMIKEAYERIFYLEEIIKQLQFELEFYRQKSNCVTYNNQIVAY